MFKRLLATGIATAMTSIAFGNSVSAINTNENVEVYTDNQKMEDILTTFHEKAFDNTLSIVDEEDTNFLDETVSELCAAGYEAYSVTPSTYNTVETKLNTSLSDMGLKSDCSYIIAISGENTDGKNELTRSSTGSSFTYTYNGTTYTMRYMTVTAADDSNWSKFDSANLLKSTSKTLISNCINAALYAYIGSINSSLGTIATVFGLDINDFAPDTEATFDLYGSANWTRIYTQVKSPYDNYWYTGSSVENVQTLAYYAGSYYEASSNRYETVNQSKTRKTTYSSNYNNSTWKKQKAVAGFNSSWPIYDMTGGVQFKHGSKVVISFNEDF